MVFHSIIASFFASETLKLLMITLLVMAEKQWRQVRRWLAKGRDEILPQKTETWEQATSWGMRKLRTNLGHLKWFQGVVMCYGKKRSAILTKNTHAYALVGRAAEIQNSSTFGRENTAAGGICVHTTKRHKSKWILDSTARDNSPSNAGKPKRVTNFFFNCSWDIVSLKYLLAFSNYFNLEKPTRHSFSSWL